MNISLKIPAALLLIWLTVSLGAILPTTTIKFSTPVSTRPQQVVVSPPTQESSGPSYFMYFLQAILWGIVAIAVVGAFVYRQRFLKEALMGVVGMFLALLLFGAIYFLADKITFILYSKSGAIPAHQGSTPSYAGNMLILIVLSVVMGLIFGLFVVMVYRRREVKVEKKRITTREAVEKAIYEVKIGKDVRGAILSAYKEMELLMRTHGVEDKSYYTPREFREFALSTLKISPKPVDVLTTLFEIARYSGHHMSEEHRKLALNALEEIKNETGGK
ncbi:hypothetical protein AciM339_0703 [Aciduliprofundum sp. MAR08-339]|uniref:DUF4129 domain-containing protein n=1 Tax=Aciduliprofundum sp. (strain MAR08-339) TaxID=673860 RepID=UPI0002A49447|nr:hypothetical protein AciM339_0703 [Aciduliprofundum sp. MAR08-339]